jgi:long-chain fatty acid transport protein
MHGSATITKLLLVSLLLAGVPWALLANGMRLVSQDAFASARGEAFVATADNPSAIYYNPAGISQLAGLNLRGGLYGLYLDPTFQPPDGAVNSGNTYHIKDRYAAAAQLFGTYRSAQSPLSLGLGIYAPYGASITWPQDTGFRSVAIEASLIYMRFNPVAAVELLPGLSLGAGVMVDYGNISMEQGLRAREMPFVNSFRFSGDGWSVGYNAGLLWQPHPKLALGATLRSATPITMDGETEFEQQPVIQPTTLPASAEFEYPYTVTMGISFRPTPRWNFEFNADYTDWSSLDTVTIYQHETPPYPVQQDVPVTLNWRASWMYAFGVTRYFDGGWRVSAGYVFNESSVPNDYYSPLAADLNRHFVTIGVGHKGRRWDFDITYQFGYGPDHTVTGSTPASTPALAAGQTADGTYDFVSHGILVSVGLHF